MSNVTTVLAKLERLHDADRAFAIFGARTHQYRLGPPLADADLRRFERHHHIILPSEYRDFLLQIGNGGAGPYYGLQPLEAAVINAEEDFLARPFVYTHWWNGATPPNWWELPNAHALDEHQVPHEVGYEADVHVQGTLRLAHQGCGYYCMLVVSGHERGHMWSDERAGDGGIMPLPYHHLSYRAEGFSLIPSDGSESRVTFLAWYEDWLDSSLQRVGA